jgi:RecA-family ATPase
MNIFDQKTWQDLERELASVTWLWQSWLPHGYVTMLAADPGIGKSMFALSVAQKLIAGGPWFDNIHIHEVTGEPVILWVECEAGEPFHIARAKRLGLDTSRVITMQAMTERNTTPILTNTNDKQRLESLLRSDNVALAVIDSLSGAIQGVDENTTEVGKVVQWLSELARDTNKPILLIHHMNKSAMRTRNAEQPPTMADLRGSSSIPQHCRVIWSMDSPYGDPSDLRLSCMKNNLASKPHPIRLLIHPHGYIVTSGEQAPTKDFRGSFDF